MSVCPQLGFLFCVCLGCWRIEPRPVRLTTLTSVSSFCQWTHTDGRTDGHWITSLWSSPESQSNDLCAALRVYPACLCLFFTSIQCFPPPSSHSDVLQRSKYNTKRLHQLCVCVIELRRLSFNLNKLLFRPQSIRFNSLLASLLTRSIQSVMSFNEQTHSHGTKLIKIPNWNCISNRINL